MATTDAAEVLEGDADAVVIATRHDSHAEYATRALAAGKHVFVEKPLALDHDELAAVESAARDAAGVLMVGFNRRFAPLAGELREALGGRGPLVCTYRVNAGRLPKTHWTHDPKVGGGRIVGEVCHFVDFAAFLASAPPVAASVAGVAGSGSSIAYAASKGAVITLTKALALECAPHGVRVVAIAPVATHTPMLPTFMNKVEVDEEGLRQYIATVPLGRLNEPQDLANTAVFLASDDAAMITGSCVEVDGGRCI
jgi:predicted dehydrogenase